MRVKPVFFFCLGSKPGVASQSLVFGGQTVRGSKEGLAKVLGLFVERAGGIKVRFLGLFVRL